MASSSVECPGCRQTMGSVVGDRLCETCGCRFRLDVDGRRYRIEEFDGQRKEIYVPNRMSVFDRFRSGVLSGLFLFLGITGLQNQWVHFPARRHSGLTFWGPAASLASLAVLFAAANLLIVILDHYDRRDNELRYRRWARFTNAVAFGLLVFALLQGLFHREMD